MARWQPSESSTPDARRGLALVTGASGYVGGRLVPELLAAGWRVRAMARSRNRLRDHPWVREVEVVEADVTDEATLRRGAR